MKVQLPVLLATAWLMSGCSGLHPFLVEDAEIAREGRKMAVLDTCVARGLASGERISRYRQAQRNLLSVSVHNDELYQRRYDEQRAVTVGQPNDALRPLCQRAGAGLSDATLAMEQQYLQTRGAAAISTAAAPPVTIGPTTAIGPNAWAPKP